MNTKDKKSDRDISSHMNNGVSVGGNAGGGNAYGGNAGGRYVGDGSTYGRCVGDGSTYGRYVGDGSAYGENNRSENASGRGANGGNAYGESTHGESARDKDARNGNAHTSPSQGREAGGRPGAALFVVVFVVVCVALLLALFYNADDNTNAAGLDRGADAAVLAAESRDEAIVSLLYDAGENTEFCLYKGYIIKCSRDSFSILNKSGEELFRKSIDFQRPALTCAGDYLLVYDIGGRSAFVVEDRSIKWEEKFSNNIINASINKSGYMAVVTEESGYRNSVKVMAPLGRELFTRVIADDYVVFACVSDDNAQLMVNRIKTMGVYVRSGLEFIDLNSNPFAAIESDEGYIFLGASFIDGGSFSVATETDFMLYNNNREIVAHEKYGAVLSMCEFPDKSCTVASQKGGEYVVASYGVRKPEEIILKTESPVVNMSSNGDFLVVNTGRQVIVIGGNGKVRNSIYFETDILYTDIYEKTNFLVVTDKRAELYKINK